MRFIQSCSLALALGGSMLLSAGCDTVQPPGSARVDPLPQGAYAQIVAEGDLGHFLAYTTPSVQGSDETPMSVSVPVRLMSDEEANVQYRFEFFDRDGRPLLPEPDWVFKRLPSRTQVFLQGNALDTKARDWRLIIRPAR